MRNMTQAADTQVRRQFGAEPLIVIGLKINPAGNFIYYGDRTHEKFEARITDVSGLDNVINISQTSNHASVTVQLIDPDGELKQLFNDYDLHKRPCRIYQYFPDTDFEVDKILLFEGQLASPVIYDEAQMTLTLTALSKIEDVEVGFSPDNSLWTDIIPNEIEPQAWPMPFGTPINYPLVQITQEPYGTLIHGFGINDFTSPHARYARYSILADLNQYNNYVISIEYVGWHKLNNLARDAEQLQRLMQDRQEYLTRVQVTLANTLTDIADRDSPTQRTGTPQDLAIIAKAELRERIVATQSAARELGFGGPWYVSALDENVLRNAQYEYQDIIAQYNKKTEETQAHLAEVTQEFNRLRQKRSEYDSERERVLQAIEAQEAAEEQERQQYLAQEKYTLGPTGFGSEIAIWNGQRFPFDRSLWLKIGSSLVYGRFKHKELAHEGVSYFKVTKSIHPRYCDYTGKHCTELQSERLRLFPSVEYGKYISSADVNNLRQWSEIEDLPENITNPGHVDSGMLSERLMDYLKKYVPAAWQAFNARNIGSMSGTRAGFHWEPSGGRVRIAYGNPVEFILSIIPCELLRLAAYRTHAGERHLATIPPNWYTISDRDYGDGLIATVITLKRPLDSIANAGFEGQLYATVKSTIGPNVVDVIRYLVEKYFPDTVCDEESFATVTGEVAIWPTNFVLLERYNIIELLSTICYQACIGIWFSEGVVYLRYLPNMPENTIDITEDNINTDSLQLSYTPTEDITTKIIASYKTSYDLDKPLRLAARYNISKYGVSADNINYLIYNDREAVVHSLTFWLIRKANTWKYLEYTTALDTLAFETMDAVSVKLRDGFCAHGPVTGIIEQVEYDSAEFTLKYRIWLPVRAGEMETYKFAYYNIGDIEDEFPEPRDWATGNGLGPPIVRTLQDHRRPGIVAKWHTPLPEIQNIIAPVALQPKNPKRQYDSEPEIVGGGSPEYPHVAAGYDDPHLPDSVEPPDFEPRPIDAPTEAAPKRKPLAPIAPLRTHSRSIGLYSTMIQDENSGEVAILASFFKGIQNNLLRISSKLPVIDDNGTAGIFEMLPAPEHIVDEQPAFAAKYAYLAEDDDGD